MKSYKIFYSTFNPWTLPSGNWISFLNNEEEMFGSLENKEQIVSQNVIIVKIWILKKKLKGVKWLINLNVDVHNVLVIMQASLYLFKTVINFTLNFLEKLFLIICIFI